MLSSVERTCASLISFGETLLTSLTQSIRSLFERPRILAAVAAIGLFGSINLASSQSTPTVTGAAPAALTANGHLPRIQEKSADLISIASALTTYGNGTTSAADDTDPRVTALAANLGGDVDRIYDFVRNSVDIYPTFGLGKGAVGALLDRDADAFDHTHLFVELVRASGFSARYVLGSTTLTPTQATNWLGPSDAVAMCRLLAFGGIPGSVNGQTGACGSVLSPGAITDVTILHLWAEVQIGGTWYTFDPAFKAYETISARPVAQSTTLAGIMGMSSGEAWSTITSGATLGSTSFGGFNHSGLESALDDWSEELLDWQTDQAVPASVTDIVGGRRLIVDTTQVRDTAHPRKTSGSSTTTWTGDIPDQYRTKITITGGGINWTTYADAVAGHRVTIDSIGQYAVSISQAGQGEANVGNPGPAYYLGWHPVIRTDQCLETIAEPTDTGYDDGADAPCTPVATGNAETQFMTVAIDAPLAAQSGAYLDESFSKNVSRPLEMPHDYRVTGLPAFVDYPIAVDLVFFQGRNTEDGHLAYRSAYTQSEFRVRSQYTDDCVLDENGDADPRYMPCPRSLQNTLSPSAISYMGIGSYWLNQSAQRSPSDFAARAYAAVTGEVTPLVEAISGARLTHHYSVGFVSITSVDIESRWSSVDGATSGTGRRAFRTIAGFIPAFEAAGLREAGPATSGSGASAGSVWTGAAALKASSGSGEMLKKLDSGDVAATELPAYSDGAQDLIQEYIDAGYTVAAPPLPQTISAGEGVGVGFYVINETTGSTAIITLDNANGAGGWARALKGAAGLASAGPAERGLASYTDTLGERDAKPRAHMGAVDLRTGSLGFSEPVEVSIGQGDFPYQLPFQRSFSSEGFADNGGLGQGWTHNYSSHVELSTSIFNALGKRNPRAASDMLAALRAAYDVASSGDVERMVTVSLISAWWVERSLYNTLSLSVGASSEQFVRLADGVWAGAANSNSVVTFSNFPGEGIRGLFNVVGNPTTAIHRTLGDQSVQHFTAVGNSYYDTKFRWALTSWEFPQGITVTLDYRDSGNLDSVSTPLASLAFDMSDTSPKTEYECQTATMNAVCSNSSTQSDCTAQRNFCAALEGSHKKLLSVSAASTTVEFDYLDITSPSATAPDQSVVEEAAIDGVDYERHYDYAVHATQTRLVSQASGAGVKGEFAYQLYNAFLDTKVVTVDDAQDRRYRYQTVGNGAGHVADPIAWAANPATGHRIARFDMEGRLVSSSDELGRTYTTAYDAYGRTVSRKSAWGDEYVYAHDARHNVVGVEHRPLAGGGDPDWWRQTVEASAEYGDTTFFNRPTEVLAPATADDATPLPTLLDYDSDGQLISVEAPPTFNALNGNTERGEITFTYDAYGRPLSSTDATGMKVVQAFGEGSAPDMCRTSITLDPSDGNPFTTELALRTEFECDAIGNVTAVIDPRGKRSETEYDLLRRKTAEFGPTSTGIKSDITYDADGNVTQARAWDGSAWRATTTTYSATGRPLIITDPDGDRMRTCYDALDRVVAVIEPDGSANSGATSATNDGRVSRTTYNAASDVVLLERWTTATLDPSSDSACALTAQTAPSSPGTNSGNKATAQQYRAMTYNAAGLLETEEDANGNITTFTYEGLGRVIQTTYAPVGGVSQVESFLRDERGQILHKAARDGRWARYYFDAVGRETHAIEQEWDAGTSAFVWKQGRLATYDLSGRRVSAATYDYPSWHYRDLRMQNYDAAGRGDEEWAYPDYTNGAGDAGDNAFLWYIQQEYDDASNRTALRAVLRWAVGWESRWTYDDANRMVSARAGTTDNVGSAPWASATFAWDALSRRTSTTLGNGVTSAYDYEDDSDVASIDHTFMSGSTPASATFTYATNPNGQLAAVTTNNSAFDWLPPLPIAPSTTSVYDRDYSTANPLNQVTSETVTGGTTRSITWDAIANMASASLDGSATTTSFTHDGANRLKTAVRTGMSAFYDYDAQDRRVIKAVTTSGPTTVTTRTLWDGADEFIETDGDARDDGNANTSTNHAILRLVLQGPGVDDRVAMINISGSGGGVTVTPLYLHRDRLGSTIATTNASGQVVETFSYSPYGESDAATTGTPWRYTGRYFDAETGLYHYRARYYAPRLGQFLETDPIGTKDDPNLYGYVLWDPANLSDPSGLKVFLGTREVTPAVVVVTPAGVFYVPAQYHMFLVTHADFAGDPNGQIYSWGPQGRGPINSSDPKRLTQQFAGTALNDNDRRAWQSGEATLLGRTVEIDADDDVAAASARNILGGADYDAVPGDGVNSNAAAYGAASDADRASGNRPSNAQTPKPQVGTPGWDEAPRVQRCTSTGSRISRSC